MNEETLPRLYAELERLVGLEAVRAIAETAGGQRVFIAKSVHADQWLTRAVGEERAKRIAHEFGGEYLTLPVNPFGGGIKAMRRNAERALDEGCTANEAAARSGLHVRNIYRRKARRRIVAARKRAEPDLFDPLEDNAPD